MSARRMPHAAAAPVPPALAAEGPLGAIMLACRAAAVEWREADEAGDEARGDAATDRIEACAAAAALFAPLNGQQALFALAVAVDTIDRMRSEAFPLGREANPDAVRRCAARATGTLHNLAAWLAAAHGASLAAPEVAWFAGWRAAGR